MPAAAEGAKAVATVFANVVLGRLDRELDRKYTMWKNIETASKSLKTELEYLAAAVDDQQIKFGPRTAVARVYGEEIRELTHDIEDCIERFLHRITCKPGASRFRRWGRAIRMARTRVRFARKIEKLKNRVIEAKNRAKAADSAQVSNEAVRAVPYLQDFVPVGISEATKEVQTLLDVEAKEDNTPEATPLRVVAILGLGGSGKTTLAKAVYNTVYMERALRCAWVNGKSLEDHNDADGVVNHIKDVLRLAEASLPQHQKEKENRFLIVIDGIKENAHLMDYWDTLRREFRDNGRIIVTTTSQPIANTCCNHPREDGRRIFGRVYNIRSLGEKDSMQIALMGRTSEIACMRRSQRVLLAAEQELLKKCGGLPLALRSVARQLMSEGEDKPTLTLCEKLCSKLGSYLESEPEKPSFARLRGVLRENYTSLSDYNVRTCMLYLGIFPMNHPLKKNVIIRRWLAEGYARDLEGKHQSVAEENFETFMTRSIILPIVPVCNTTWNTCKTHSIMHVFMLHKSMSMKFIMPFGTNHKKVRHLFIHGRNSGTVMSGVKLSCVRSLTVLGNAGDAISNISKYKLTRVLDLEGCIDVNDGHLKYICKLWNLRYLSLGPNITKIPNEIAQLQFLETLDVSKTTVNVIPVQAIGLPCLIHLIGKFKFQGSFKKNMLPKECMLETIAGFVPDKGMGFLQLMDHMKRLNKVKIWCDCEETEQSQADMNNHLAKAIQNYAEPRMGEDIVETHMDEDNVETPRGGDNVRSLSLDFQALPQGPESALDQVWQHYNSRAKHIYRLSSLKLYGDSNSDTLANFLGLFKNLSTLILSTTVSVTRQFLSVISKMALLSCLEIIAGSMEGLVIHQGNLMRLKRLCLVLKTVGPPVIEIKDGARPEIISLQLICKDLVGLSGIEIMRLHRLKEISLHPQVDEKTIKVWEAEARKHHNRPSVLPNSTGFSSKKRKNVFRVGEAGEGSDKEALVFLKKRKLDKEALGLCAAKLQNMSLG